MSSFMFNRKGKSHQLGCTSITGFTLRGYGPEKPILDKSY
jgi:hypothetical protein